MALTKVLASEYAPHGVLVNVLLVGLIVGDRWVRRHRAQQKVPFEEFIAKMEPRTRGLRDRITVTRGRALENKK